MLLVIDVGNTNIVFGIYKDDELLYDWRISTLKDRTSDEYGLIFNQIFQFNGINPKDIKNVIMSSVVPPLMHTLPTMSMRYLGVDPMVVGIDLDLGINIKYDNPNEIGADRLVNAVAGYKKYGGPLIIVDVGTAITFCSISKEGDYLGGIIFPGIKISSEALFMRTAKLPKVEILKPDTVIGKTTSSSIQSGLVFGYIGMIDYMIKKMIEEMGTTKEEVKVVGTGGFSTLIASESEYICEIDKLLTLEGLKMIYERNR